VRKKTLITAGFILVLFLIAIAGAYFVKFAQANPYMYHEFVSPPVDATPLLISVSSPKNNVIYNVNDVTFTFNISTQNTSIHYLLGAYFKADWLQDNVTVYKQDLYHTIFPEFWNYSETFLQMPDGEYSIVITAWGGGGYAKGLTYYFFDMTSVSVVNFTVDATSPKVSILSPENKTYDSSDIPLDFTVSEKPSLIRYSIDGQENSTLYGNTILADLHNGRHNLTVYVWDVAGNLGVSEAVAFNIAKPESFQTTIVVAPMASITVVGVGLAAYFKKRKR